MNNKKTSNQNFENQELRGVVNCHCDPCRHWTGHFMAGTSAEIENFTFESDSTLTWWNRSFLGRQRER